MRGVNKVIILGNVGKDPEVHTSASGAKITSVSVATSEAWTDKQTGQKQERTEWHRIKFFGRLAEIAGEYLKKGKPVYVEGSLRTEKYTDKTGSERYSTDVVASVMQLVDSPANGGKGAKAKSDRQDRNDLDDQIPF